MISIEVLAPSDASARAGELQATYEAMYGIAPGEAADVPAMLAEHAGREGFRFAIAADGGIRGMAYGFTGRAGQPWRDEMAAELGLAQSAAWLDGHFELAEFGVVPAHRRRGLGSRLHATVLAGLPHRRAVLTVREDNRPARAFYARHGWQVLRAGFAAAAGHGPYAIMGRHLHQRG